MLAIISQSCASRNRATSSPQGLGPFCAAALIFRELAAARTLNAHRDPGVQQWRRRRNGGQPASTSCSWRASASWVEPASTTSVGTTSGSDFDQLGRAQVPTLTCWAALNTPIPRAHAGRVGPGQPMSPSRAGGGPGATVAAAVDEEHGSRRRCGAAEAEFTSVAARLGKLSPGQVWGFVPTRTRHCLVDRAGPVSATGYCAHAHNNTRAHNTRFAVGGLR